MKIKLSTAELFRNHHHWNWKRIALFSIPIIFIGVFYFSLPRPLFKSNYSTVVYDANHKLLSARIAQDGQWRFPQVNATPYKFEQCLIAFEDRYFYYHPGINIVAISKVIIENFKKGTRKRGGSTLTMQLARLTRGNKARTYLEKIIEMWLAIRIECSYSKSSILNYYACNAPFGGNVVGVHTASWRYFGRDANQLSWAEAAMLAVLPNAPSLIYPGKNHDLLLRKRNGLLYRLFENKTIDATTYKLSLQEEIPDKPLALPQLAPHLLQRAMLEYGEGKLYQTTVVKELQQQTIALLEKHSSILKNNQINNAAALILDTETGNVLAYVGNNISHKKLYNNDVDMIASKRSSGSILKPILFASLIHNGSIAPHSLLEDVPTQIGAYAPKNFNLTFDGLVPASEALSRSLNVPAVKMLQQYGVAPFIHQLKNVGFSTINKSADHYGLSLILGGAEVTPWDVGRAYATMGRTLINFNSQNENIENTNKGPTYIKNKAVEKSINSTTPLSASSLWTTFQSMSELVRPDQYAANSIFSSIHKIAWKTGTSFGFRDGWAVGLNQKYTVVVWVGNADGEGRPGLTGIDAAAPLLFSIFNSLNHQQWFKKPSRELMLVETCYESGFRVSENCPTKRIIEAPTSVSKSPACPFHKIIHTDSSGRFQVNSLCYPVVQMKHKPYLILTPLQLCFYKRRHLEYVAPPPLLEGCQDESAFSTFDVIYPRQGFKVYLPIDEQGHSNEIIMDATHSRANSKLYWYLDKIYLGETLNYHQMAAHPAIGKHLLTIVDQRGKTVKIGFEIVGKRKK